MRILVCVKEVPDTEEIKIDPIKNTIIRTNVENILNPYDAYALEKALEIRDEFKDVNISVLTMGPKGSSEMLKSLLALDLDNAYLLTDRKFSGSDTLATSHIISEAIKHIENKEGKFDLIFCGKQAIDGETAQVGPEIAENLSLGQITYANKIEIKEDNIVRVTKEIDDAYLVVEGKMPLLITFTKSKELRFPTIKGLMKSLKKEIEVLSLKEIDTINTDIIGLKGSPTLVNKMYSPKLKKESKIFNLDKDEKAISFIASILVNERKL